MLPYILKKHVLIEQSDTCSINRLSIAHKHANRNYKKAYTDLALQTWKEGAMERVSNREQACIKLHRVSVSQQYDGWALLGTSLLQPNGQRVRLAAALAAWSEAIQVPLVP